MKITTKDARLWGSDDNCKKTPQSLGITVKEYGELIVESLESEQVEGHVMTSKRGRVYAA